MSETAKKIVKFFSRGKHAKKEKRNDGLISLLLSSFLGIMICAVCLAGGTFAWFTESQTTAMQTITAATYKIKATVSDGVDEQISNNGVYNLNADTVYYVTLDSSDGTATTGYCIIKLGDIDIHTEQFPTQDNADKKSITFKLEINESVDMEIIAHWGTSENEEKKLQDGETYTYGNVNMAIVNAEE